MILSFVTSEPVVLPIDDAVKQHRSPLYWDWVSSFDRDHQANPLQHPDVVLADLASAKAAARLNPVIVREEIDGHGSAFGVLVPKTVRSSQVGGVGPEWTLQGLRLVGGRILGKDVSLLHQRSILNRAARYAAESHADFLLIEDLDQSAPLYQAIHDQSDHGCLLFVTQDYQPRHYIDFPGSESEYLNSFSSHCRKLFRRIQKKCANSRLQRIATVDQIPEFLHASHEISRRSWQSHQFGMRVRNDEAELRQMTTLAMHGMLRSYLLWIDGTPAAFAIGNQHAGCFRYEETGFSTEVRHLSPGRVMLLQMISDLLNHDPVSSFDFGFGDAEYKRQFCNRESRSGTIWLVPPTLRARLSLSHLNVCKMLRSAVFTRIKQSSVGLKARQWIRSCSGSLPSSTEQSPEVAVDVE